MNQCNLSEEDIIQITGHLKDLLRWHTSEPTVITYNDICSQLEIIRYKAEELIIEEG